MKPEYSVQNLCYTTQVPESQHGQAVSPAKPGIVCAVVGCLERRYGRRLCRSHYVRWRQGDPDLSIYALGLDYRPCGLKGCERPHQARDLCQKHYIQKRRRGHPLKRSRAEKGTGSPRNRGYHHGKPRAVVWVNGKTVRRSRWVWEQHHGPIPDRHHIHHKNGNPLDDRIENLECVEAGAHIRHHWAERRARKRTGGAP